MDPVTVSERIVAMSLLTVIMSLALSRSTMRDAAALDPELMLTDPGTDVPAPARMTTSPPLLVANAEPYPRMLTVPPLPPAEAYEPPATTTWPP